MQIMFIFASVHALVLMRANWLFSTLAVWWFGADIFQRNGKRHMDGVLFSAVSQG